MKRVPKKNISLYVRDVLPPMGRAGRPAPPVLPAKLVSASQAPNLNIRRRSLIRPEKSDVGFSRHEKNQSKTQFSATRDVTNASRTKTETGKFLNRTGEGRPRLQLPSRAGQRTFKNLARLMSVLAVFFIIIYAFGLFRLKQNAVQTFRGIYANLEISVMAFKDLRPDKAGASLVNANASLAGITKSADKYGLLSLSNILDSLYPVLSNVPGVLGNLKDFLGSSIEISSSLEELKSSGLNYFVSGEGDKLLKLLRGVQKNTNELMAHSSDMMNQLEALKNSPLGKDLRAVDLSSQMATMSDLYALKDLLGGIIPLLESPQGTHLALFFQNPSEMRPSGGFIGSYADLLIKNGALEAMDVRDIYDPDGQLDIKVEPPKPLQGMTVSWGARDANWFFDFPTSAKKVLWFLESSKIYSEQNIKFAGAIAINTDILTSILRITGPIELPTYNLTLTADNFLAEVQKEVEAGENKSINQPKKILKDFTPLLLERLKLMNDEGKEALLKVMNEHIQKKDVQIYFRDDALEGFMRKYGVGGEISTLPERFVGDYLAVVNANVAGGKTDVYMNQTIRLQSRIDSDGFVHNDLSVLRKHNGDTASESWYRATNQDYLKIYAPAGSTLISIIGNTPKTVYPRINYRSYGYATDTEAFNSESGQEFGKTYFDAWLKTPMGESKTINFIYDGPAKIPLKNDTKYTFIFDRQSGVRGGVNFSFEAPAGFKWLESDKPIYEYKNDDSEKRVTIELTLMEI